MKKILKFITDILFSTVGIIGLAVMLTVTFGSVLSRFVLPVAWAFTEELTCGLFILVSLLGAALAVKEGDALGISIITDNLPLKIRRYFKIISGICTSFFGFLLLKYGIQMVQSEIRLEMKTAALQWPEAVFGSFIPIGGMALILCSIVYILNIIDEDFVNTNN
ncbi:Hypothetical protein ING2D1G_1545 [Peptoniphilus sp. ING2-D1G]|nr:Hypothetical protein ING2D1G_1545 [Peptoniphilus sp. ING2-D1G]